MASLYNADLKPIGTDVKTHPYEHATKLFVADNYKLAPKQAFLYYVVLNVNQSVGAGLASMVGSATNSVSSQSLFEQYEAGLLIKRVELPKFNISNKTYNAYNRKNIVSNIISYDPISITFHDDAADVVNRFWNDYYTYYYRDSDYNPEMYSVAHKYEARLRSKWGFSPLNRQLIPFLKDIQIFSLHNKRFTEYRLINPIITSWRHGVHDSSPNNELMTNSMTIAYETVKYRIGTVNPVDVNGFSLLRYDTTPSPISTSVTNINTNAGIIGAIATAGSQDLARPDGQGSGRGLFSDLLGAYNLYNNIKNINFKSAAGLTIGQYSLGALNGVLNGSLNGQIIPTSGGAPGYTGNSSSMTAGNPLFGQSPYPNSVNTAIGGAVTTTAVGAAVNIGTSAADQAQASVQRGLDSQTVQGSIGIPFIAQIAGGMSPIPFNAQTGQTGVGNTQVLTLNQSGQFVPSKLTLTQNGFNPGDIEANQSKPAQTFNDGSGYPVTLRSYADGSSVAFDQNNNVLYTVQQAGSKPYNEEELKQINANAMRALNVDTTTGTRFITNPNTGVITAVGGTTAMISNTLSQTAGAVGGVIAGQKVYEALARTGLGKSLVGQIVAGGLSTAVGGVVYKTANNLLQPILNKGVGAIGQVFDEAAKGIKNIVGQTSGELKPSDSYFNPDEYTSYVNTQYDQKVAEVQREYDNLNDYYYDPINNSGGGDQAFGFGFDPEQLQSGSFGIG